MPLELQSPNKLKISYGGSYFIAGFNVAAAGDSNIHTQALDELQWK